MSFGDVPRRATPRPLNRRRRVGPLIPTLVILAILLVLLLVFASIWTDVLWYRQLGFLRVLGTEMVAKTILFLLGAVVMGAAVLGSLVIAYRSRPVYAPVSMEQASLERYREGLEPMRRLVTVALPVIIGLFAGSAAAQQWQTTLLWLNRTPFGVDDPQFGMDVGFFVFTLPWLQFLSGFFTAVVFLAGLAALVTHYLYGGLRLQGVGNRITSAARLHLGVVAAVFLLLRAVDYWLGRYALSTKQSQRIPITGLTYTDANAVLTARGVLAVIATMIAVLFLVGAFVERWRLLPLYGVALLVVSAIIIGGIYPAIVQRFQVTPNALTLERTYIQRAIQATRDAYGLSDVEVIPYAARSKAEAGALRDSAETVPGIRLLDPLIVDDAFLYAAIKDRCRRFAVADGAEVEPFILPESCAENSEWGYLARTGDLLLGSTQPKGTAYRTLARDNELNTEPVWYPNMKLATSTALFALGAADGKPRWAYSAGRILDTTLAVHDGAVFFLESTASQANDPTTGRAAMRAFISGGEQYLFRCDSADNH